jgi:hypothetical protein
MTNRIAYVLEKMLGREEAQKTQKRKCIDRESSRDER